MNSKISEENLLDAYKSSSTNILNSIDKILDVIYSPNDNDNNSDSDKTIKLQELIESTSMEMTSLKYYQRSACVLHETQEKKVKTHRLQLHKNQLLLQSLEYEREHLKRQIELSREYDPLELAKIARDELQDVGHDVDTTAMVEYKSVGEETIIDQYLSKGNTSTSCPGYRDIQQHTSNIKKLTNELEERKNLVETLNSQKQQWKEATKRVQDKKKFLTDLPSKLANVEKASLPLQEHFHGSGGGRESCPWMGSSEKRRRVMEAQELQGPLYVLCGQVQAFIDAFPVQGKEAVGTADVSSTSDVTLSMHIVNDTTEIAFASKDVLDIHPTSLRLEFCCPSVNKNVYRIYFLYSTKLNIVLASTVLQSNSSLIKSTNPHPSFLINLFPGDDGKNTPNLSNYHQSDAATNINNNAFDIARPYHWAQWISGLSFLSDVTTQKPTEERIIEASTQSVICQLKRRVRAQSTLSNLISLLEKKPETIPTHPTFQLPQSILQLQQQSSSCRIVHWTELSQPPPLFSSNSEHLPPCRYFYTKIKKNHAASAKSLASSFADNIILEAYIQIRLEYPDIPPYWILQTSDNNTSSTTNTITTELYQTNLKTLQTFINTKYNTNAIEQPTWNDWILSHQMHLLISCWNIFRTPDFKNFGFLDGIRIHRGKNRTKLFISR